MNTGLYIHVPFCRIKCDYCSFYSEPVKPGSEIIDSYMDRLIEEIRFTSDKYSELIIDTVYFGGGTSSMAGVAGIDKILSAVSKHYTLHESTEVSIELNPLDLDRKILSGYRGAGVSRISLGIQTLDERYHKTIGRSGTVCSTGDLELFFSESGFDHCVDIMTGLPGQNEEEGVNDLEVITSYKPEHISLYLLSVEEATPLFERFSPDSRFTSGQEILWDSAISFLKDRGYRHYEVSNFAIPGYESRHNLKYWKFDPYIGLGPGAHSFVNGRRYSTKGSVADYVKPGKFTYIYEEREENDSIIEFIMTSLRLMDGFTEEYFLEKTGKAFPSDISSRMDEMVLKKLIGKDEDRYFVTDSGLRILNEVTYRILENYL